MVMNVHVRRMLKCTLHYVRRHCCSLYYSIRKKGHYGFVRVSRRLKIRCCVVTRPSVSRAVKTPRNNVAVLQQMTRSLSYILDAEFCLPFLSL